MAKESKRVAIVSPAALAAMPFPVDPVFRMRPGLERLSDQLAPDVRELIAPFIAPDNQLAFALSQDAAECAVKRSRMPLVMSFEQQTQSSADCGKAMAVALGLLTGDTPAVNSPSGIKTNALLLRRSLQDDFVLMMPDGSSAAAPGMLRAAVMGVAQPSGWDPAQIVGRDFAQIHRPVADAALIQGAAAPLSGLMLGAAVWRRFVWTLSVSPELSQHPDDKTPGTARRLADIWFRCERQLIVPLPGQKAVVFLIRVYVARLLAVLSVDSARACLLCKSLASMSPAVVAYKHLEPIRELVLAELGAGGSCQ